jgi:hypothetical protein
MNYFSKSGRPDFGDLTKFSTDRPSIREVFLRCLDPETNPHFLYTAFEFVATSFEGRREDVRLNENPALERWAATLAATHEEMTILLSSVATHRKRITIRELSPLFMADGSWLQDMVKLAVSEWPGGSEILESFFLRVDPSGALMKIKGVVLRIANGTELPWELDDSGFVFNEDVSDEAFRFALLPLCLGRFPQAFYAELVGLNVFFAQMLATLLRAILQSENDDSETSSLAYSVLDSLDRHAMEAANLLASAEPSSVHRIIDGFTVSLDFFRRWHAHCSHLISASAHFKLLQLMKKKAIFACGYHSKAVLEGVSLDTWFSNASDDPEPLVDALSRSNLVTPGSPETSALTTSLIDFGGPMFEVFTESEKNVLREWVLSLDASEKSSDSLVNTNSIFAPSDLFAAPPDRNTFAADSLNRFSCLPPHEVTFYLLNADQFPIVRPYSRVFSQECIGALRPLVGSDPLMPYKHLDHPLKLIPLVEELHKSQINSYDHKRGGRKSKESLIQETLRNAAVGLLDGAWMQGAADVSRMGWTEYSLLFRLYYSELGDGVVSWNHNVIMRRLLESMGLELPPTHSRQFFFERPEAIGFEVAKMNLALALNQRTFLPEVLGLNLAIESFGVGGRYREMADALDFHQYDPIHASLHNSIDNFSSGHTRMSVDAIIAGYERVRRVAPNVAEEWWLRCWSMFAATRGFFSAAWESF